ncbi:MAG: hypothetical protein CVV41_02475 [Candidatus Riflebacteria bacterium HGW-Riflebacteria-1]|jgi:hypothetical protein|nr:MAG: hypothetical protein CVV41_02475 [Candidatus Riflebacteria bacterium HGW-Riflebacteria-1]
MVVTKPSSIARLVCSAGYTGLMGDKNKSYKLLFSHAKMVEDPQRAVRRCHLECSQDAHASYQKL